MNPVRSSFWGIIKSLFTRFNALNFPRCNKVIFVEQQTIIGESLFQVTRIELKESLGLRTASRTELLKSEKTSTAERYSVLRWCCWGGEVTVELTSAENTSTADKCSGCFCCWGLAGVEVSCCASTVVVESGEAEVEVDAVRWEGIVEASTVRLTSRSSPPAWVRIWRQVLTSRMIFSAASASLRLNPPRLTHSWRL